MRSTIMIIILAALAGCGSRTPADKTSPAAADPAVAVRAELAEAADGGLTVAWIFDLADGWHLYWHGLNDSGYPPSVDLDLPPGWRAGSLRWPAPERYELAGGILDHVYHGRLVLLQDLAGPDGERPANDTGIDARVRWLACRQECVPGQQTLTLTVPGRGTELPNVPPVGWPDLPTRLPEGLVLAAWSGDSVAVTVPGAETLRFFPYADSGPFADLLADGEAQGERMVLRLRPRDGVVGAVRGLLQIVRADGTVLTGPFAAPAPLNNDNDSGG